MESSKNGILIFLLLVLIILVAGMSIFGYFYLSKNSNNDAVIIMNNAVPQEPDRWEYTFINGTVIGRTSNNGTAALIERANELGEEGWELVSSSEITTGFSDRNLLILFLKRKLP